LKRPETPLDKTYTEEPAQDGERAVVLRRVGKVSLVGVLYHIPAAAHPDLAALDVMSEILTAKPAGRLYKALVETKKATSVSGGVMGLHDPGILEIVAQVADESTPEEVRDIMLKVLEKFAAQPVTPQEVARAKQALKSTFEQTLADSKEVAIGISDWIGAGDWRLMFLHRDRIAKVTIADVERVAKEYLRQSNRTLGMYIPTNKVARAIIPKSPKVIELVKDYKGQKDLVQGETFDPTPANLEKRIKRLTLPGGLKVGLLPKKTRGETVVGTLVLHFGNEESLAGNTTAAGFLGRLMMRGTKRLSRQQIEDLLNKLEANLDGSSGTGQLNFSWQAKRKTLAPVLDLLREILREPTFPENEFDILKRADKQKLEKQMTEPSALAIQYLRRKLNPYPKTDIRYQPTFEESLERLDKSTRDQVAKLYATQIGGQSSELVLVGDFDADAVVKQISSLVADWKTTVPFERIARKANPDIPGSRKEILTPDKESATFLAGETFLMTETSPEYPALLMGNYLLGGSDTSRLMDRLRQKEGLSYGASSYLSVDAQDQYGSFVFTASCKYSEIGTADKAAMEVVSGTLKNGITENELSGGIKSYLQETQVRRANDLVVAAQLRQGLYLGRTFAYYADLEKKIAALSAPDVNQALARFLSSNRLVIIRAGDFNKK
jgi:zinc protease